ncbi:MAG: A/G-specific adenine glycosylase [Cytophagaceae bacterium]
MKKNNFVQYLLNWYSENKRDLPWRNTDSAYEIWLSEVMLQQTRVDQALPYYHKFIENYPEIQDLAQANEIEVLRLWQGLGYYSRGRNLHSTAKTVTEKFNGKFPENYAELLKLKGIGHYTAAAIASFAFNEKVAVVDGNVYRVLSRIFGIEEDISTGKGIKFFREFANQLIPEKNPGQYNQAIMEFGALYCVPSSPSCNGCIFEAECYARIHKKQSILPVKTKKLKKKNRYFNYLVIEDDAGLIMKERKDKDIWQGLYEFPVLEENKILEPEELLKKINGKNISIVKESKIYSHILTHQNITSKFWIMKNLNPDQNWKQEGISSYNYDEVEKLPKPVLINKFLNDYNFL